jgi:hypothetical protein
MNMALVPKASTNEATLGRVKSRSANTESGSIGFLRRRSTTTNAPAASTAAVSGTRVPGEVQPWSRLSITP